MLFPYITLSRIILPFLLFLRLISAHRIEIDPGGKECFFENLQPQDRVRVILAGSVNRLIDAFSQPKQMTVTYEVGGSTGGGHLDIDFFVG